MSAQPQPAFESVEHYQRLASCVSEYMALSPKRFALVHELCTKLPAGANILEIGVCYGHTAIMLADFAKRLRGRYYGIDRWNDTSPSSRNYVQTTLDGLHLSERAALIEGDSRIVPWPQIPLDFLLIDGGHDESCVSSDVRRFLPWVKIAGFVAFDDCDAKDDPASPCRAVKKYAELACDNPKWKEVGFVIERTPNYNTVDCGIRAWQRVVWP
jgi:predicted O-methyltransferase YrrM